MAGHVLYDDAGELKAATVLSEAAASLQVESPHGRRGKIKAANVLLRFTAPPPGVLLAEAQGYAEGLDLDFLWQCAGEAEFGYEALARDYVGRDPVPVEAAGVLLRLHGAPMYFYRRGRGRFQAAPAAALQAALAGLARKREEQARIDDWTLRLARFECPPEILLLRDELLYAPDRRKPETRAFEEACRIAGLAPARLFERCGALPDAHDYHLNRFLHEFYPRGTDFAAWAPPAEPQGLPSAGVLAFSLDDESTTEIDDAFSLETLASGELRVGIHIAAPALGIQPGSPLDAIARERLSTAYMPGRKITMLPEEVIARYSLDARGERPVVSLYLTLDPADFTLRGSATRIERVRIADNLRHARLDALNQDFEQNRTRGLPFEEALRTLWRFALTLEARRGKPSVSQGTPDYVFHVDDGRVRIEPRRRGAPLDKLVAELMILANATWGEWLAGRDVAALYRVQSGGKVRMSVHAEAHDGLGVHGYAWLTSPLRRYVDLVNQWQLVAALTGRKPPFGRSSEALLSALRAFELTHARYDEHQRGMETYWSLRWLEQEGVRELEAGVLRDNLVRLDGLPLVQRVPSLPVLEPGARVRLAVRGVDLIERSADLVWRATLG